MESFTREDYFEEIQALADVVMTDYEEDSREHAPHEIANGHQWVICPYYHRDVLRHCDSWDDAEADLADFCGHDVVDPSQWDAILAYICLRLDIESEIARRENSK